METIAGKYTLLKRLAAGGMAEVFLARQRGPEGFSKLVVIKRILPHLAQKNRFVQMFLDEARTAADLNHPNVVHIYEVGQDRGTYFIAMEYLQGQNLRAIWKRAAKRKSPIPWGQSLQVILDAARGLHYAHTKTDYEGKPLNIVHRDVSPHNVLVTYDGNTKIVDFGIAKAASHDQSPATSSGIVRGKLEYMSPEQASGLPIDARSDQFALSIILFELTTGKRVFKQATDYEKMRAVIECRVPIPSEVIGNFSPRLEEIILRALSKDPGERFRNCGEMADAIEDFLAREGIQHSPARVGQFIRLLFEEERETESRRNLVLQSLEAEDDFELLEEAEGEATGSGATRQMITGSQSTRTNLTPATGADFVGRVRELSDLAELIAAEADAAARLITLWGPAGTGKTRLAEEVGRRFVEDLPGGVWMFDLTEARTIDGVCAVVGNVLGVPLAMDRAQEDVVRHLGRVLGDRGKVLLIFDNFEQVVDVAEDTVGVWLQQAGQAIFVVTSREPLRIPGERAWELGPLQVPEGPDVAASEAVQLFVRRARSVRGDYNLTEEDEPVVAKIVQKLDGMPLAIELAARRMNIFTPAQLLKRLHKRLDILTSGTRETTGRQATLRGAIDWSWELLDPEEKVALAQCSVFTGGFDLEGAEAVLQPGGDRPVLDIVQALREKSLLRTYESPVSGDLRFGMYESVRAYAAEKLVSGGQHAETLERHADYYLERAQQWVEGIDRLGGIQVLLRLTAEMENLLAVSHRAQKVEPATADSGARALRAVLAMEPLLSLRGPLLPLLRMIDGALEYADGTGASPLLRIQALHARGRVRQTQGKPDGAEADYREAHRLADAHGESRLAGRILRDLGILERDRGHYEQARRDYEQALELAQATGDTEGEGRARNSLGRLLMHEGHVAEAKTFFERSLALLREVGARRHEGRTLANLAGLLLNQANRQGAREYYEQALAIHREFGDRRFEGIALGNIAILLQDSGFLDDARVTYEQALRVSREIGDRFSEGAILGYLATLYHEEDRLQEACRVYEQAVDILRDTGDTPFEGLFLAAWGAALADQGRLIDADDHLTGAAQRLASTQNSYLDQARVIHEGHLAAARAREAEYAGDEAAVAEHMAAAHAAFDIVGGTDSGVAVSEDVRIALRLLERALEPGSLNVGEVALVFTDVEGSTALWDAHTDAMRKALDAHNRLLRKLLVNHDGLEVKSEGDAFMIVFNSTLRAVRWCLDVQRQLMNVEWPPEILADGDGAQTTANGRAVLKGLRVRMGVHVGRPERRPDPVTGRMDYFGPMVNRASRVMGAAHGGQILVSSRVWQAVGHRLDELDGCVATDLGEHRLRGLSQTERLVQLLPRELAERDFPPPRSAGAVPP